MFLAALSDKSCSTDANKQETAPKKVGLGGKNVKPWQGPNGGNNNGVKPNGGNEGTKTLAKKVEACVKSIRNESHEFTVEQLLTELETLIKDNSAEGKHPFSTMKFEDDYNHTLLRLAARYGKIHIVKSLIDAGAEVNAVDDDGNTPLHLAVKHGKGDTVKALLGAKDIHVNAVDKDDRTPLHVAVKYSKGDTVQALIAEGANVNAVDNKGWTPLHRLAHFGGSCIDTPFEKRNNRRQYQKEIVLSIAKSLLEVKGINVNAADKDGKTPLALATERRDSKKAEEWEKEEAEAIIALLEQYSKT